jgi:hypothetical protein
MTETNGYTAWVEQNRKDARAATASFTGWTRDETELFLQTVGRLVKDQINPLKDEIAKLKTQVAEFQQNGVRFCGAHQRAIGCRTGEMVSYDGSIWCAVADVKPMEIPGKAAVWQLAVRGQPQPRSPTKHGELRPPQLVEERRTLHSIKPALRLLRR